MQLSDEIRNAHAGLSRASLQFLETAVRDPRYRQRSSFADLENREALKGYALQGWPTLVGTWKVRELERVAVGLDRLMKDVPRRFFQKDIGKIAEFYGFDSDFAAHTMGPPNGAAEAMSRGDFIVSPSGLRCLEYNCGSMLAGWQLEMVKDRYLRLPVVSQFLAEQGLRVSHRNTMQHLFSHLAQDSIRAGLCDRGELNVAFAIYPSDPDSPLPWQQAVLPRVKTLFHPKEGYDAQLRAALKEYDELTRGEVILCSFADFEIKEGFPYRGQTRVHAIVEQLEHPSPEIFQCFKSGRVQFYTGPFSMVLSDKRNLALLSESADSDLFSPRERELIHRHIPWTRRVRQRREDYGGRTSFLPDLLISDRRNFVLKKGLAMAGTDVHIGRFTDANAWQRLVEEAITDGSWIMQEFVESLPYVYQEGEEGCEPHDVVWGLFVFGQRYTGANLRMLPRKRHGVINIGHQSSYGLLLEAEGA